MTSTSITPILEEGQFSPTSAEISLEPLLRLLTKAITHKNKFQL